ncbi:MAG: UDP-3-O-(3-hydroxymyristoyl)glucosamine N-acyltransferase [Maricaulaceae bacterium]
MIDFRFYDGPNVLTVAEIIEGLSISLPDPSLLNEVIKNVAPLDVSNAGDISFLSSKRDIKKLKHAKATACFVVEKLAPDVKRRDIIPLVTPYPRAHFSRAVSKVYSRRKMHAYNGDAIISPTAIIHETAIIGANVKIGANVIIHPYAVIGAGVKIGNGTEVDSHVKIECAVIGKDCRIKAGAVIGGRGFGVDRDENGIVDIVHIGRVLIGDRVQIGSHCCVDRGQLGDTCIEDDVKLDNFVQVAHNVSLGAGTLIAAQTGISGSCTIGKNVLMGGNVGIADHLTIGDGAQIAGRAGVMHDIPAGEKWSGVPAMPIREHMKMVGAMRKLIQYKKNQPHNEDT